MAVSCYHLVNRGANKHAVMGERKGTAANKRRQGKDSENANTKIAIVRPLGIHNYKTAVPKIAESSKAIVVARLPLKPQNGESQPLMEKERSDKTTQGPKITVHEKASHPPVVVTASNPLVPLPQAKTKPIEPLQAAKTLEEVVDPSRDAAFQTILTVDKEREEDPFYCSEYAEDIFHHLKECEAMECYRIPKDFLSRQAAVSSYNRAVLIDWLVQIHTKFCLLQETLHITVDTIDRFLKVRNIVYLYYHVHVQYSV